MHRAEQQLQQARDHLLTVELAFSSAKDKRDTMQQAIQTAREESSQLRRQIQEARDLDSKLVPLKTQADAAEASSAELIRQAVSAVERFDAKANERVGIEEQIALLEMDHSSVRVYQPFTAEGKLGRSGLESDSNPESGLEPKPRLRTGHRSSGGRSVQHRPASHANWQKL